MTVEERFEMYLKSKEWAQKQIAKNKKEVDKINIYSISSVKQKLK